ILSGFSIFSFQGSISMWMLSHSFWARGSAGDGSRGFSFCGAIRTGRSIPKSRKRDAGVGGNRESTSSAFRESTAFRYSSSRRHPPFFPRSATTGIPRALRAFRSRKTVRLDTSSSSANSLVVTFPRRCRRRRRASNRSPRMAIFLSFFNHDNGRRISRCSMNMPLLPSRDSGGADPFPGRDCVWRRKVIVYIAMSLDGYIARENGEIDWLLENSPSDPADYGYPEFYGTIDTVIMGKATYDQLPELTETFPYKGKKCYVFS